MRWLKFFTQGIKLMRIPYLAAAFTALTLSVLPFNKTFGQTAPTQDTVAYAEQVLVNKSQGLGKDIYRSRVRHLERGDLDELVQTAQLSTRPIKVTVVPSGHAAVDTAFTRYARKFEAAFNKAVQTHPDTILNRLTQVASDSTLLVQEWLGFSDKSYNFVTGTTPVILALRAYQDFAAAMKTDRYLTSFECSIEVDSGRSPTNPQEIILTLVPSTH
jgi:hypothetical protein